MLFSLYNSPKKISPTALHYMLADADILENRITGDESWVIRYPSRKG